MIGSDVVDYLRQVSIEWIDRYWGYVAAIAGAAAIWASRIKIAFTQASKITNWFKLRINGPELLMKQVSAQTELFTKRLDEQDSKLKNIEKELTPNGGKSSNDLIRKIHELALVAELRTRHMVSKSNIPIYECEPTNGMCINANQALCELFGMQEKDMLGNGWLAAIAGNNERQQCWSAFQTAIESNIPYTWEYPITNQKTHEKFTCRTEMSVLRDQHGYPVLYQGNVEVIKVS